ncbi:uncharacterized mitochondrial protein-like protein [Tanacetum coccineum]
MSAERKHRHIVETGLAMLFNAHVPASYWVDAFTTATFIINRLPTPLLKNKSPFELLFNQHPQYDNFRTYGCQVFPYLRDYSQHKLEPRSILCIFIGYSLQHKGYRCLDPTTSRVFVTRHARFNETVFPFIGSSCNPNISTLELTTFLPDVPQSPSSPALKQNATPKTQPTSGPTPCSLCSPSFRSVNTQPMIVRTCSRFLNPENHPLATHIAPDQPTTGSSTSSYPMTTRSKAGIFKHKYHADLASLTTHLLHVALLSTTEPRRFKTASAPLLLRRASPKRRVYRIKYNSDGTIERYKARLVAQGCSQIPGLDYCHTFSPVVKASTVRIVISLAVGQTRLSSCSLVILASCTYSSMLMILFLTGNDESVIATFTSRLNHEFAIKDLGALNYFLGLEVAYTDNVSTPRATHYSFTANGILIQIQLYRSLVGALQYLTITRPDLSYAVNQVSQFLHAPTIAHFQSVKRILRYVKGTISFGLTFSGNLVSWSAKKQPTVSRSSCESEYRAMANTAAEIVWITHLLQELHALPPDRPTLLCDNKSALFMTQNPVSHKRAKHIDLDYHFIRELVHSGKLYTKFVPTNLQVADIFTKSLPRSQFETFRTMLRLGPPPFRLKGDING